jgi:EamA domain-containing membrane protein RarD
MSKDSSIFNSRQLAFKELFVGTLIYAVTLGFFNDYTSLVYAKSFSTIFYASILLEILTFLAILLKGQIVYRLKDKQSKSYKLLMFFCVWLVLFLSKFVFIWAIDFAFGDNININGFFGILLIALCVTVVHKLADYTFLKLGEN